MNACRWGYTVAFVFAVPLFGADMILVHGHVYTGNPEAPWAQSLAVTRSRIEALGTDAEILRRNEPKTKVIDLGGRTVVPGFIDVHTHMMYGAMALRGFNLSTPTIDISPADQDAFVNAIRAYAASHRSDKILFGRANFPLRPDPALKIDILDRAAPDRPVVIHSTSEHALWVNSRMLAINRGHRQARH